MDSSAIKKLKIALIKNVQINAIFSTSTVRPFLVKKKVGISDSNVHLAAIQNAKQKVQLVLRTAAKNLNLV